jgi:hypothetical protein
MHWIDRLEKVGRLVLWLTLASAVVLVPLAYINLRRSAELEEAGRQAARLAAEQSGTKENRLLLSSMGSIMTSLNVSTSTGRVWFSNVSARTGIVCVLGSAKNSNTNMTSESLPSCKEIPPYASNVAIEMMFAGSDVQAVCKQVSCSLEVRDVADVAAPGPKIAAAASP